MLEPNKTNKNTDTEAETKDLLRGGVSSRAVQNFARSFISRVGNGLLSVAGLEWVEEDEEAEPIQQDPVEQAAEQHFLDRERQLADWRTEFQTTMSRRQELQDKFDQLSSAAAERVKLTAHEVRQRINNPEQPPSFAQMVPRPVEMATTIELAEQPKETEELPDLTGVDYALPGLHLFDEPENKQVIFIDPEELEEQKFKVQETLDSFGIDATVWDAVVGPRVTQLRVRPGMGVRVESITSLSNNIALALAAESIRIQAPVPGKPYVGIEIPNGNSAPLNLGLMFRSVAWNETKAAIPLMLGMELGGTLCITDLAAAPHMLIAGATGSGKSVCMNTILMCLLNRFTPDELEMILIDPKRVEFGAYGKLPHLVRPVITEPGLVVPALQWAVREMENRYKTMAAVHARNIATYNEKMKELGEPKMPYLVIIIDELADIMLTAGREVETALARIAQLSRAVGIHTIIATQRPSVNVITGMIKANFPTRIAFKVSSQIDSRTILDGRGAEALRGQGDMLFSPPGIGQLQRVQGPWVNDSEIARIVIHCAEEREQCFKLALTDLAPCKADEAFAIQNQDDKDPMMDQAIEIILRDQRATTSYLQRCLRIGYNRAANLIEELERRGIVGPQIGNTPREILIDQAP